MEIVKPQRYLNPLTLEANMFLKSITNMVETCDEIDINLYTALDRIVITVDNLLGRKPKSFVETAHKKLVTIEDINSIDRIYRCTKCNIDLGSCVDKAVEHLINMHKHTSKRQEMKKLRDAKREENSVNNICKLPKKANHLCGIDLALFFSEQVPISEQLKTISEYDCIEKELMTVMVNKFPGMPIKIYFFGSRISGIGTRYSDLDIFIDIGKTFYTFENRPSKNTLGKLYKIHKALYKKAESWPNLLCIDNARVPILKVQNASTGIYCDIGVSNSLGYVNTKLLEYMFDLQPIARRMCIFIKKWLTYCKLTDYITTYSMALMIIHFLQIKNVLPAICELQGDCEGRAIGPWLGDFQIKTLEQLGKTKVEFSNMHVRKMLRDFFYFYSQFKYNLNAVCPYLGRIIPIQQLELEMPTRYTEYIHANSNEKEYRILVNKSMVVQDPIQLNHNVTKAISPTCVKMLIAFFKQSAEIITI